MELEDTTGFLLMESGSTSSRKSYCNYLTIFVEFYVRVLKELTRHI